MTATDTRIVDPTAFNGKQWIAAEARQRWTGYGGAEGGGKTFWEAQVIYDLMLDYPGIECLIGRFDFTDLMSPTQIHDVFHRIVDPRLIAQTRLSSPVWTRFHGGSRVTFVGLKDYHPSAEFGAAAIDQVEEVPEETVRLLNGRLRQLLPDGTRPHYRMLLTWNPHPGMQWFHKAVKQYPDDYVFVRSLWTDNAEHLPADFEESRRRSYTDTQYQRLIEGKDDVFEGAALPEFNQDIHVIPGFPIPPEWPIYRGIDHGLSDHPTVCLWCAVSPDGNLFFFQEYVGENKAASDNARSIAAMSLDMRIIGSWIDPRTAMDKDINRPEWSVYKEYKKQGVYCQLALEGSAQKRSTRENRLSAWKQGLYVDPMRRHYLTHQPPSPRIFIFEQCTLLIGELPRLQKRAALQGYEDIEKIEDDGYDAGGFALTHLLGQDVVKPNQKPTSWMESA